MEPTAFVVDDDTDTRESIAAALMTAGIAVRAFADAKAFDDFYRPEHPGCLVLDVGMPDETGIAMYERLLRDGKRLPVIFITAHADVRTAVAAMKSGAFEFLEKPFRLDTLVERVHHALADDAQWREQEDRFRQLEGRFAQLTERERATLELIVAGEPNKRIASQCNITERAVEMRRAAIMRKLGVRSLAELLDAAVTHRLLTKSRQAAGNSPSAVS